MCDRQGLLQLCSAICLVWTFGVSMNAYATSTFTWKEEVLLHDGKKIIVERSDTYDSSMNHKIGQGAPLAEHETIFLIPGTNQTVIWKSDNRPSPDPDNLHLLALDFLGAVPYVATLSISCVAYNKWHRPNPPHVYFKYVDGWKRVSLEEFPEKFKINLIVTGRKNDTPKIFEADRKFGFVPAQIVAEINREPGRSKQFYSLFREPIDLRGVCPEPTGPDGLPSKRGSKAPVHITPPNSAEDKK